MCPRTKRGKRERELGTGGRDRERGPGRPEKKKMMIVKRTKKREVKDEEDGGGREEEEDVDAGKRSLRGKKKKN
jgi:hypothetical protein